VPDPGSTGVAGRRPARGARALPLRVWVSDDSAVEGRMCLLRKPFRLGFGAECDIRLDAGAGEEGPPILFELQRTSGPLLIASAVPPQECAHYVDLRVNGEPLQHAVQELAPGSRLDITDKSSQRHYQLVLHPAPAGILRPRNLAILMLVLTLAGAAFGGYLYWSLRGAKTEISRTTARMEQAQAQAARSEARLLESISRLHYSEAELNAAVADLRDLQDASAREIRTEFGERIKAIDEATRSGLERLAEEDTAGRRQLAERARADIEQMRGELSERMVDSYKRLKGLEQKLLAAIAERAAAQEPAGERFKRISSRSAPAILFLRTRYQAQFVREGTVVDLSSMGTGFVVSPSGLAVTAQHVLFPWRYEREFLLLERLGLARVVPDSARWDVWPSGVAALADPHDSGSFDASTAYRSDDPDKTLRLLFAPEPKVAMEMVQSPIGPVALQVPVPGSTDGAVLRLLGAHAPLPYLAPPAPGSKPEALDEVLVLSYPFSRLHDGVASPQAVRGFVRRVGEEMLELNAAVHPGSSGGVVLDRDGAVVGMVVAILSSELYGVALPGEGILSLLSGARDAVRAEEARLAALGCDPGAIDGEFDARTRDAYRCEAARASPAPAAPGAPGTP